MWGFWSSFSPFPPGMCPNQTMTSRTRHLNTDMAPCPQCSLKKAQPPEGSSLGKWDFWASLLLPVSLIFPNTFVGRVSTWAALPRAVRTNSRPSFFVSHGGKEEALSNESQMPVHLARGPGRYPFPTQPTPSQLHPRPGAELGATQPCSATHSSDTSARSSALSSSPSRMTNLRATCRDRKDRPRLSPKSHV